MRGGRVAKRGLLYGKIWQLAYNKKLHLECIVFLVVYDIIVALEWVIGAFQQQIDETPIRGWNFPIHSNI